MERWKTHEVKIGKKDEIVALSVAFDPDQRVVVGGAYVGGEIVARLTTRRPTDRFKLAVATGFRCAADANPLNTSLTSLLDTLPSATRARADFDLSSATGRYAWKSSPGKLQLGVAKTDGGEGAEVQSSYAVINGFSSFALIPVAGNSFRNPEAIAEASLNQGPVPIGLLTTSVELTEPALPAGTYLVSFRGAGAPPKPEAKADEKAGGGEEPASSRNASRRQEPAPQDGEAAPAEPEEPVGPDLSKLMDLSVANFVIYDLEGTPLLGLPAPAIETERTKKAEPSVLTVIPYEPPKHAVKESERKPEYDTGSFAVKLQSPSKSEVLIFTLNVKFARGSLDGWNG
jgi:hypothetical protein